MAVVEVNELEDERTGPEQDGSGNVTYTRGFEVITNSTDTGTDVLISALLPGLYSAHPDNPYALCIRRGPPVQLDPNYWTVNYQYSTKLDMLALPENAGGGGPGGDASNTDPTLRSTTYKFSARKYQEAVTTDFDVPSRPIKNSAGDPYQAEPWERTLLVITVKKNVAVFNPAVIGILAGATNSGPFLVWNSREVLLDDIDAEPKVENNTFFWEVQIVFVINPHRTAETVQIVNAAGQLVEVNPGGWWKYKLDAGYRRLTGNKMVPVALIGGTRPTQPHPLNGSGDVLDLAVANTKLVYQRFKVPHEEDFNLLGLF